MIKNILKKPSFLNPFSGIILQLFNLISTFILPKIILSFFGSEVNGLVSSISNFLLYISIFEASVSNIVMSYFYKPIRDNDMEQISKIFNTCDRFYRKISILFITYTIVLSILYPVIFNLKFSFGYVASLTIILSLSYMIQYSFSNSLRTLLKADKKVYVVNFTQTLIIFLNLVLAIISVYVYPSIHLLKFISGLLFILQPIIFSYFVNKKFKIDKKAGVDDSLIKSRWDGLSISIASFVHNMTDIAFLTIFTKLEIVSVYSVYYLVIRGLESIMTSISNGILPSLGNLYVSNKNDILKEKLEAYEMVYSLIVFIVFTVASVTITPFVLLYTGGISDANYYQPIFGYLIIIGEALFLIKMPHQNMAYAANKYKEMKKFSYVEALINVIVSLLLVKEYGLIGVAIGTTIAMLYRAIAQINFTNQIIKNRDGRKYYLQLFLFSITSIISVVICKYLISIQINTWFSWIIVLLISVAIISFLFLIVIGTFYRKQFKKILTDFIK